MNCNPGNYIAYKWLVIFWISLSLFWKVHIFWSDENLIYFVLYVGRGAVYVLVFPWQQITHDIWLLSFGIEWCMFAVWNLGRLSWVLVFGGVPVCHIVLWSVQSVTLHMHIPILTLSQRCTHVWCLLVAYQLVLKCIGNISCEMLCCWYISHDHAM